MPSSSWRKTTRTWNFLGHSFSPKTTTGTGKPPLQPRKGILSSSKKKKPLAAAAVASTQNTSTSTTSTTATPACSVQFGPDKAAEFENDAPNHALVTTPAAAAARCFSTDEIIPKNPPELQATAETKCNAAVLAEWEDSLDELLQHPINQDQRVDMPLLDLPPESTESFEPTDEVSLCTLQ